jgi:hypothetical protein
MEEFMDAEKDLALSDEMWSLLSEAFRIVTSGSTTGQVAFRKRAHAWMDDCRESGSAWRIKFALTGELEDDDEDE